MRVIATKPGYYGKLRQAGEEFDVPDKEKASWFAPVVETKKRQDEKPQKAQDAGLV